MASGLGRDRAEIAHGQYGDVVRLLGTAGKIAHLLLQRAHQSCHRVIGRMADWLVVQALAGRLPPGVELATLDRPGGLLIPLFEKADKVILIDAMQGGGLPGEIRHFGRGEWAGYRNGLSSHGLGVFEALMLASELNCLPETLDLYGIEIGSATIGDPPSQAVLSAAGILADRITNDWQKLK